MDNPLKKNTVKSKRVVDFLKKVHLTFTLFPLTFTLPVHASGPGTTTAELLKIPIGARAIGMGEAFTGLADDSSALAWNPAGMAALAQKEATFMHSQLIESVHYEHLAYVAPGDHYSFGTSLAYLGYGDIPGYDNSGNSIGNQTAYSYILSGGLARKLRPNLSLGLTGEIVRQTLADESAGTIAFNGGLLYTLQSHPWDGDYKIGASLLHLGPGLKFVNDRDPLPRKYKLGMSASHIKEKPLNLTMDITIPNDNSTYLSLGGEYWFKELLALRLGYIGSNDEGKGIRLGMGFLFHGVVFDYAYGGFGDFGATHRIGLSFRFGEPIQQMNQEERAILKEAKAFRHNGNYVQAILAYNEVLDRQPNNNKVLGQMISTHEDMLKQELKDSVADVAARIPSPQEAALSDLLPGQPNPNSPYVDTMDPMGYGLLPDVNNMDTVPRTGIAKDPLSATPKTAQIDPKTKALAPTTPRAVLQVDQTPALSPADIYNP